MAKSKEDMGGIKSSFKIGDRIFSEYFKEYGKIVDIIKYNDPYSQNIHYHVLDCDNKKPNKNHNAITIFLEKDIIKDSHNKSYQLSLF